MTPLQRELSAALDRLARELGRVKRPRSLIEANPELTNGYCSYVFACGFASLGDREAAFGMADRARRLRAAVEQEHEVWLVDEEHEDTSARTHALLMGIFETRVEQALAGMPYATPLPDIHIERYIELHEQTYVYRIDRMREASRLFDLRGEHAFMAFDKKMQSLDRSEPPQFRGASEEAVRAKRVAAMAESLDQSDDAALAACIGALPGLRDDQAMPVLVDILEIAPTRRARLELCARALEVVVRFRFTELVPRVLASVRDGLASGCEPAVVERAVSPILRVLRHLKDIDELRELIELLEARIGPESSRATKLALAGARLGLGDERGGNAFQEAHPRRQDRPVDRLVAIRDISNGYAHADARSGIDGIRELIPEFSTITDTFGVNTHYCYSVLWFVDALVYGLLGLDFSRPGWEPRE